MISCYYYLKSTVLEAAVALKEERQLVTGGMVGTGRGVESALLPGKTCIITRV